MHNFEDISSSCKDALQQGQTKDALDRLWDLHTYVGNELHREIKNLMRGTKEPEAYDTEAKRRELNENIEHLLLRCEKEYREKAV